MRSGALRTGTAELLVCAHAALLIVPIGGTESAEPVLLLLAGTPLSLAAGLVARRRAVAWLPLPPAALLVVLVYAIAPDGDRGPLDPFLFAGFFAVVSYAALLLGQALGRLVPLGATERGARR
jgi:hypothetical protein